MMFEPGTEHTFRYPDYGTPDGYPEYTAHDKQKVTIVRLLTTEEFDDQEEQMYLVRATDGWQGHAWESELDGTARPLRD